MGITTFCRRNLVLGHYTSRKKNIKRLIFESTCVLAVKLQEPERDFQLGKLQKNVFFFRSLSILSIANSFAALMAARWGGGATCTAAHMRSLSDIEIDRKRERHLGGGWRLGAKHWGAGFHGEIASDVGVCVCMQGQRWQRFVYWHDFDSLTFQWQWPWMFVYMEIWLSFWTIHMIAWKIKNKKLIDKFSFVKWVPCKTCLAKNENILVLYISQSFFVSFISKILTRLFFCSTNRRIKWP